MAPVGRGVMAVRSDLSLHGMIPLVLHKINRGAVVDWEDVSVDTFSKIIDFIGNRWAVFAPDGLGDNAKWMLTFDDGYLSDYDIVFPLLVERGIKATFFLITSKIGTPGHISWSQVDEMHRYGMCIGSHSVSHRRLSTLSIKDAEIELYESKQQLESFLGAPVDAFSYPFGDSSSRLHQLGLSMGYRYLCTSMHGVVNAAEYIIPRNSIYSTMVWKDIVGVMEPKMGTRLRWVFEDQVKGAAKGLIGRERYIRWRNWVLGEK